jgi:hypothetical protein
VKIPRKKVTPMESEAVCMEIRIGEMSNRRYLLGENP